VTGKAPARTAPPGLPKVERGWARAIWRLGNRVGGACFPQRVVALYEQRGQVRERGAAAVAGAREQRPRQHAGPAAILAGALLLQPARARHAFAGPAARPRGRQAARASQSNASTAMSKRMHRSRTGSAAAQRHSEESVHSADVQRPAFAGTTACPPGGAGTGAREPHRSSRRTMASGCSSTACASASPAAAASSSPSPPPSSSAARAAFPPPAAPPGRPPPPERASAAPRRAARCCARSQRPSGSANAQFGRQARPAPGHSAASRCAHRRAASHTRISAPAAAAPARAAYMQAPPAPECRARRQGLCAEPCPDHSGPSCGLRRVGGASGL